ncbi:hypothetical protein, partial [Agrobacterium vitis]|uniref:hypothetical protein n=1 Tax=Agrobacterium vitis TaxID=373 RepID=UPI001AED6AD8
NFVATNKSIICHANLQIKLETFSHTQQASKYTQSNGAETALTLYSLPRQPHRLCSYLVLTKRNCLLIQHVEHPSNREMND